MLASRTYQGCDVRSSGLVVGEPARVRTILLPIELPDVDPSAMRQAASLARHFGATLLLLHVLTPLRFPAGVFERGHELTPRDLSASVVKRAQHDLEQVLSAELRGVRVYRLLLRGSPASEILRVALEEQVDLIVMPTQRYAVRGSTYLGAATTRVLQESPFPVWVGIGRDVSAQRLFNVRNILCALDLTPHSRRTLAKAARWAGACGAGLTLVHVTSSVEMFGPGGSYINEEFKTAVVGWALRDAEAIQHEVGTAAPVVIESGKVRKGVMRAAAMTRSDVLIVGRKSPGGHIGQNGYGIALIRESHLPVLSL